MRRLLVSPYFLSRLYSFLPDVREIPKSWSHQPVPTKKAIFHLIPTL